MDYDIQTDELFIPADADRNEPVNQLESDPSRYEIMTVVKTSSILLDGHNFTWPGTC